MIEEYEAKLIDTRSVVYMIAWVLGGVTAMTVLSPASMLAVIAQVIALVVGLAVVVAIAMALGEREHDKRVKAGVDHDEIAEIVEA